MSLAGETASQLPVRELPMLGTLEMALKKMGHDVVLGKGVAAAKEILLDGY